MNTAIKTINQLQYATELPSPKAAHDLVITEEPLLISLTYYDECTQLMTSSKLTLVMRTPGNDKILVLGLLFSEGIIKTTDDVDDITIQEDDASENHIEVTLKPHVSVPWDSVSRHFTSQSSCGICGKNSLKALSLKSNHPVENSSNWLTSTHVSALIDDLKLHQPLFESTGAVHGAGYWANNKWLSVHEDVGRHNAVDKVIGELLSQQKFYNKAVLILSGRVSFELMQKAIMASIPIVIAVGAPSSLAISAAQQFNITLIGFTKARQFNVYSGNHRIS